MSLDQLVEGQAEAATVVNENFVAVEPASVYGRCASTTSLLTWGYYGGNAWVNGGRVTIADGTVALTASSTNYIEASASTGAVSANTTGFTAGALALYTATTNGTTVTAYSDKRFSYGLFQSVMELPTFMGALVRNSADATAQDLTAGVLLTWGAEVYDTNAFHSTSSNTSRLTISSGLGISKVRLAAQINLQLLTSGEPFDIRLYKNGAVFDGACFVQFGAPSTGSAYANMSTAPISVADGDYFEIRADTTADASCTISSSSWFAIEVVEATRLDQHRSVYSTVSSSAGTLTLDLSGYEYFKTTLTENVSTVTVTGLTSGVLNRFEIRVAQDATGGRTWANPASWKFPGGTAYTPSAAASAVDILRGRTYDGGTTWEIEFQKGYA